MNHQHTKKVEASFINHVTQSHKLIKNNMSEPNHYETSTRKHVVWIIALVFQIFTVSGFLQYPGWKFYNTSNNIHSLAQDGNELWIGSLSGLMRYNMMMVGELLNSGIRNHL